MRNATVALLSVLSLAGCGVLGTAKVDNPVLGPPPPRMALAQPNVQRDDSTPRELIRTMYDLIHLAFQKISYDYQLRHPER